MNKKIRTVGSFLLLAILFFLFFIGINKIDIVANKEKIKVAEEFLTDSFTFKLDDEFLSEKDYMKNDKELNLSKEYSRAQRELFDKYNIYNRSTAFDNSELAPFPDSRFMERGVKDLKIKDVKGDTITYDITLETSRIYDPSFSGDVSALFNMTQERDKVTFKDLTLIVKKVEDVYTFEVPKEVDLIVNEYNLTWQKRGNVKNDK